MKRLRGHQICLILSLLLLFVLYSPGYVLAIGPGTGGSKIRVSDEEVGPYVLLVATSPLPVKVGQMSVWVRVSDATNPAQLRREATVTVTATPRDGGPPLIGQATHDNAGNDYDYVAHFDVAEAGQWDVTVNVADQLGQAQVSFAETVSRGFSMGLLLGLAAPFIAIAALVGFYLWRRSPTDAQPS